MPQVIPNTEETKVALIAASLEIVCRAIPAADSRGNSSILIEEFNTTYNKLKQVVDGQQDHKSPQPGKRSIPPRG